MDSTYENSGTKPKILKSENISTNGDEKEGKAIAHGEIPGL